MKIQLQCKKIHTFALSPISNLLTTINPIKYSNNITPTVIVKPYPCLNLSIVNGGSGLGGTQNPPKDVK